MFGAPDDSFRLLLDRLAEEYYCKVKQLTAEIDHLRAAAPEIDQPTRDDKIINIDDLDFQTLEAVDLSSSRSTNAGGAVAAAAIVAGVGRSIVAKEQQWNDPVGNERTRAELTLAPMDEIVVDGSASPSQPPKSAAKPRPSPMDIEVEKAKVHELWDHECDAPTKSTNSKWAAKFTGIMQPRASVTHRSGFLEDAVKCSGLPSCRPPMLPSAQFKVFWDMMGIIALSYDVIFIPMQAFDLPDGDTSFIGMLDWFCMLFWTMDLPLNFCVGYYGKDGKPVMSLKRIACHYLRSWFPFDFFIISIDWLTVILTMSGNLKEAPDGAGLLRLGKVMRIVRSMRTLRLLRLVKLRQFVQFLFDLVENEWMSLLLGTFMNLLALVFVNHGIACLWFWLGSATSPSTTWVKQYNFTNAGWEDQYVTSLHWSLTQFTPASSSVIATNPEERVFSVIVLLVAIVAFSSFLSGITSAMTRLRTINSHSFAQTLLLNKFLRQNQISRDLASRVTRYVQLFQSHYQAFVDASKVEYLKLLSGPLKVELQWEVHGPVLKEHPFFHKASMTGQSAMHHLCYKGVSSGFLAREDVLFHWGVECDKMYFPQRGYLFYRRPPGFLHTPRYVVLTRDEWFCENALWTPWMHHGLMKTLTEVNMVTLHVSDFHATVRAHPELFLVGRNYARGFVAVMNDPDESRPFTWDVPWEIMYPDFGKTWSERVTEKRGIVNREVFDACERACMKHGTIR